MAEKSLKEQNQWNLYVFLVFNFLVLFLINLDKVDNITIYLIVSLLLFKGLILFPIVVHITNGLIDSDKKAMFVFWRIKNPLPGNRVFTELAINDPRININSLKIKYGQLPYDPIEQNQLWYSIYKNHRNDITVNDSQKYFLLFRDMSIMSFEFLILYLIYLGIFKSILNSNMVYLSYLILQYIILAYVAQTYGKRFVCNVLAEAS